MKKMYMTPQTALHAIDALVPVCMSLDVTDTPADPDKDALSKERNSDFGFSYDLNSGF